MRGLFLGFLPVAALLLVASGCASDDSTTTTTTPAAATTTETFTGTLTTNGAFSYPFVVLASGGISAQLTTLSPDSAKPIGMALGTWNGSACQVVLGNAAAIQGSSILGEATLSGDFCLWIDDAAGTVTSPQSYVVEVVHP